MSIISIQRLLVGLVLVGLLIVTVHLGIAYGAAQVNSGLSASTAPSLWVTPLILDFGPVGVGETSDPQVVTIKNVGNDTLTNFAGGGVNAPFNATQNCAGGVPAGGSCQYNFTFAPTEVGTFTATSRSSTNAGSFSIELRGEGVGAGLHVTPLSLDFGSVFSGSTSVQQVVTIRNTGLSTLDGFAGGGVNPPFGATQNCASGVPPGGTCQYFFSFSPTSGGTFSATSNSSTNAGPFSIDLQGRGRTVIFPSGQRVTPRSLDFGPVGVGATSDPLVVTITNQSFFTLTSFAGGGVSPPFSAGQNCAGGVPPFSSCQYTFRFAPTEAGVFTTTSNSSNSAGPFSIALRGAGVGPGLTVSPLSFDFGPVVTIGETSDPQIATIRNTGSPR